MRKTRKPVILGMMAATSVLLMLIEIPLIPGFTFLKYDPSDIIPLMVGLYSSSYNAFAIIIVRNICHFLIKPAGMFPIYGELMSIIASLSFVVPTLLVYGNRHTRKGAVLSLCSGCISMCIIMIAANYVLIPAFGIIKDKNLLHNYILFGAIPFNLVKSLLNAVITYLFYKRFSDLFLKELRL